MSRELNNSFVLKDKHRVSNWVVIDARGKVLGRLATQIADILRGKDLPTYTPSALSGRSVVVINSEHIVLTGNKWNEEKHDRYSGWMGGYTIETPEQVHKKDPTQLVKLAVKRMLPKSTLSRSVFRMLHVYKGAHHPHTAQV